MGRGIVMTVAGELHELNLNIKHLTDVLEQKMVMPKKGDK